MADYITTYTKIHFNLINPSSENVCIEDIAHSLSLLARANGHFPEFYSVAQHCIACAEEAKARGLEKKLILACLLHDAQEAYTSDITRPLVRLLPDFTKIENDIQSVVFKKFGLELTEGERQCVKEIDDATLYYEFEHYMGEKLMSEPPVLKSKPIFKTIPFDEAEKRYIQIFNENVEGSENA